MLFILYNGRVNIHIKRMHRKTGAYLGGGKGGGEGGCRKKWSSEKTGVARDLCHPNKYTSVHVYDSERGREEEKEGERERRRGGVI